MQKIAQKHQFSWIICWQKLIGHKFVIPIYTKVDFYYHLEIIGPLECIKLPKHVYSDVNKLYFWKFWAVKDGCALTAKLMSKSLNDLFYHLSSKYNRKPSIQVVLKGPNSSGTLVMRIKKNRYWFHKGAFFAISNNQLKNSITYVSTSKRAFTTAQIMGL